MHQTSTHDVEPAGQPTGVAIGRRTWLVLVLLCAAQFMLILDSRLQQLTWYHRSGSRRCHDDHKGFDRSPTVETAQG